MPETPRHNRAVADVRNTLEARYGRRDDITIGTNHSLYRELADGSKSMVPVVFFVRGRPACAWDEYLPWLWDGLRTSR